MFSTRITGSCFDYKYVYISMADHILNNNNVENDNTNCNVLGNIFLNVSYMLDSNRF